MKLPELDYTPNQSERIFQRHDLFAHNVTRMTTPLQDNLLRGYNTEYNSVIQYETDDGGEWIEVFSIVRQSRQRDGIYPYASITQRYPIVDMDEALAHDVTDIYPAPNTIYAFESSLKGTHIRAVVEEDVFSADFNDVHKEWVYGKRCPFRIQEQKLLHQAMVIFRMR